MDERDLVSDLDKCHKILKELDNYVFEIGVLQDETNRDPKDSQNDKGVTNADLMYIHENGGKGGIIPPRPVIQMTIDWSFDSGILRRVYERCIDGIYGEGWDINDVEKYLSQSCYRLQNYARKIIYSNDGRLAPNAPSTARAKAKDKNDDGNHPLFDTGQLARSIMCRFVKKSQ